MQTKEKEKISEKGKLLTVGATRIEGKTIVISDGIVKTARVKDEICDEGISEPDRIIAGLKTIAGADVFSFDQKLPETEPKFAYFHEWDNFAVLEITNYENWWKAEIKNDARRMVRKAEKKGVVVKVVSMTDDFARGIKEIYDESPLRQGKPFWHYKKDLETVKRENSTYLERSEFIGAYLGDELIGFDKLFYTGQRADTIQLIAKDRHRDKAPTNALISKSIEVCAAKGIRYLTYGRYYYGKRGADSLRSFKKRNGFRAVLLPRYYVPLTIRGKIATALRLHRGTDLMPGFLVRYLLRQRERYYTTKYSR